MSMRNAFLLAITVILGVVRFLIPTHEVSPAGSYEAVAHLFVGGLIGATLVAAERRLFYAALAFALCAVEIVAFFARVQ